MKFAIEKYNVINDGREKNTKRKQNRKTTNPKHLTGSTFTVFIQKSNLNSTLTYSDLCSNCTTEMHRGTANQFFGEFCSSKNFDSMKNYDISEFTTER